MAPALCAAHSGILAVSKDIHAHATVHVPLSGSPSYEGACAVAHDASGEITRAQRILSRFVHMLARTQRFCYSH
ncbi:MAG: hypothetical protein DWH97_06315 [Planctomycetota bacterium]|nr:MAG: hypothetical protein DWH97_06315 [Planctomycetota bacterium]RLS92488.1 MAG: hypothetical protein DWI12_11220 [Planctomycetota bacterium]